METLVDALTTIWSERGLNREEDWAKVGGRAGVGKGCSVEQLVVERDLGWREGERMVAAA